MFIYPGIEVFDGTSEVYITGEQIGGGGFGAVYKLERASDGKMFALKTLPSEFNSEEVLESIKNEGQLAIKIKHENVIDYIYFHDGSKFEKLPLYIIMEYAEGGSLKDIISNNKDNEILFGVNELRDTFAQLINGMEKINSKLIHRDIKPENILISNDLLKISDFGLSKIVEDKTRTLTFKGYGTIKYASPECLKYEKNSIKMDIYSTGIVFYEIATNTHPFEHLDISSEENWVEAHLYESPRLPNKLNLKLSATITQLITKMIEKNPNDRFNDWEEIRSFLKKDGNNSNDNNNILNSMIKKRLEKDSEIKEQRLEKEKRKRDIEEYKKIVSYQFNKNVLEPIKEFIDQYNDSYSDGNITIREMSEYKPELTQITIELISKKNIVIEIIPLIDEDFIIQQRDTNRFGREFVKTKNVRPDYNGSEIMAWGYIITPDNSGHNILLIKDNNEEIYGNWFMMTTQYNALTQYQYRIKPEPIILDYKELLLKMKTLNAIDIYNSDISKFNIDDVKKLISDSN